MAPLHPGFLFTSRRQIVLAHRFPAATAPILRELAELFDSLGRYLDDTRWNETAEVFWSALAAILRKSALIEKVAAIEKGAPPPQRHEPVRLELVRTPLRLERLPTKGQRFVRPSLEAARLLRRPR